MIRAAETTAASKQAKVVRRGAFVWNERDPLLGPTVEVSAEMTKVVSSVPPANPSLAVRRLLTNPLDVKPLAKFKLLKETVPPPMLRIVNVLVATELVRRLPKLTVPELLTTLLLVSRT